MGDTTSQGRLYAGLWRKHGGFPDLDYLDPFRPQAPHQCFGAQGGNNRPPSLGLSITGLSSYDRYRQQHCYSLYQQTGWDRFPHPVAAGSGSVSMATDSGYSHPGQTHSRPPKCDSRLVISAEPAHHDRVASPPSLVTRTRFTRFTFITSGGGYSKSVGYKRTLHWFPYIYLVPSPHLSNIYKIFFFNH